MTLNNALQFIGMHFSAFIHFRSADRKAVDGHRLEADLYTMQHRTVGDCKTLSRVHVATVLNTTSTRQRMRRHYHHSQYFNSGLDSSRAGNSKDRNRSPKSELVRDSPYLRSPLFSSPSIIYSQPSWELFVLTCRSLIILPCLHIFDYLIFHEVPKLEMTEYWE